MRTLLVKPVRTAAVTSQDTEDYEPTNEIKWMISNNWESKGYILMQKWKCRFVEKSLPDIWVPVPFDDTKEIII
jgi:hypothetical protein